MKDEKDKTIGKEQAPETQSPQVELEGRSETDLEGISGAGKITPGNNRSSRLVPVTPKTPLPGAIFRICPRASKDWVITRTLTTTSRRELKVSVPDRSNQARSAEVAGRFSPRTRDLFVCLLSLLLLLANGKAAAQQIQFQAMTAKLPPMDSNGNTLNPLTPASAAANSALQTFPYTVVSSRDGNTYSGVMVGESPFGGDLSTTVINVPIIPVILTTHAVAIQQGLVASQPGVTVFDPTVPDNTCLSYPNNVPLTLVEQSPIFQPVKLNFGGTELGATQYIDAFQRANFWKFVAGTNYHTILNPQVYAPVSLDVPSTDAEAYPSSVTGGCGPVALVDLQHMTHVLINLLQSEGVNTSQFPIFLFYNTMLTQSGHNAAQPLIFGFHAAVSLPSESQHSGPLQTFAFVNFNTLNIWDSTITGRPVNVGDTVGMSHEIAEWMDDPFVLNPTPAWGHVGQVSGCQSNLEVGDPLTGTNIPTLTGANGFAYDLQELAFFSWFYGAPSIGANGWFSDNGTFTSDAGAVCK
jgi:hypothetical protein